MKDKLTKAIREVPIAYKTYPEYVEAVADKLIAEDCEVIVRCKDCKYWDRENIEMHSRCTGDDTPARFAECHTWSNWATCKMTRSNDYCSCAERRLNNAKR